MKTDKRKTDERRKNGNVTHTGLNNEAVSRSKLTEGPPWQAGRRGTEPVGCTTRKYGVGLVTGGKRE